MIPLKDGQKIHIVDGQQLCDNQYVQYVESRGYSNGYSQALKDVGGLLYSVSDTGVTHKLVKHIFRENIELLKAGKMPEEGK